MFHVYGVQGRLPAATLDDVRRLSPVMAVSRARRVDAVTVGLDAAAAPAAQTMPGDAGRQALSALSAYGAAAEARRREPLSRVADVMSRPAVTVPATATVGEAWQVLVQHHVGQAPVTAVDGTLVGLVGRAELLPIDQLAHNVGNAGNAAWQDLLQQPVAAVMWSPVPSALPETDLRRAASLLLGTGLPGVPVTDTAGLLLGFVSRSDLLRAIVADPPLDLWC
jgi:CBS-domain-containing membrane protein